MEEAATAGATPLHRGLPDEIVIWEILVRLPPKCLLRCRAVCRAWRRATSARDFLLAHHGRQPTLPLLFDHTGDGEYFDIIPFDHRAGLAAANQLQSIARLRYAYGSRINRKASCDGLLVISRCYDNRFTICNPTTRQYAPVQQLGGFALLGMYRHRPTDEYRLLLHSDPPEMHDYWPDGIQDGADGAYVFTLGSGQPPRRIGGPSMEELVYAPVSVLFRGNLHWHLEQHEGASNMIRVFDTTAESFRQIRAPVVPDQANLFEMGDKLGMSSFSDAAAIVNIWVMQDYEGEVWALKHKVELPVAEIGVKFDKFEHHWNEVAASWDGDLLVLVKFEDWVLHVDVDGKLVASFHGAGLAPTQLRLKQTLVSHTFLPRLGVCVANASPFI